ncbi:MAG: hypothetical protein NC192_06595, partial [Muribaculaceae bacterium]|nr:hypothetical protein [Muribaculaceae bacterium]
IFKEFYLRRKTLLSGLITLALFFILAVSFCLSLDYGNMKSNEGIPPYSALILAYAVAAGTIFTLCHNGETIASDVKCKWYLFEYAAPLSPQKLSAVRVGMIFCSNLISLGISLLCTLVILKLAHLPFGAAEAANICLIALINLLLMIFVNAFNIRYKDPQKAAAALMKWFLIIYAAAIAVVCVKIFSGVEITALSDEEMNVLLKEKLLEPLVRLRDTLFPFFALIFAAIAVLGYFIILSQTKRREK